MKIKAAFITLVVIIFSWFIHVEDKVVESSPKFNSYIEEKRNNISTTTIIIKKNVIDKVLADDEKPLSVISPTSTADSNLSTTTEELVTHIKTPESVKAVYISSWVAGTPSVRSRIVDLIDKTELNAIVIDVKDNTGVLSWDGRVKDLKEFIKELHEKNIYVIARISAFQDPAYVKLHPNLAVKNINTGDVWRDHKGVPWIDSGSMQMWQYLAEIGHKSYDMGFDELNYDYIRFPTDGKLSVMSFPVSGKRAVLDKRGIIKDFYKFLHDEFSVKSIPISGDVFGIILVNENETKTLGQDLRDALTYFDYVAPMVYPSHFYSGTNNFKNPAEHPGEIITYSMLGGLKLAQEVASSTGWSTSTVVNKLRPWYQDFDMGATYTAEMVRAQIEAGYRLKINSWMLWDPSNKYTPSALKAGSF